MTVLNLKPRLIWEGDGNTSSIALTVDGVPLTYRDSSHIRVRQLIEATDAESDMVEGVDYTFGIGTISRIAGNLPSGYKWAIWREQPKAQEVALLTGGDLASSDVEDLGNISVEQIQEMQDAIDRAFKLSVFAESEISNELPAPAASNLIGWNAAANALVNVLPADVSIVTLVSAFMQSVIQAADAAAARTLLAASPDPLSVLRVTNAITPAEIDADQDDYAPTDHASAFLFRLTSDATWSITGLAGGTVGRIVMLANVGSNALLIPNEDASSTAANRFAVGSSGPVLIAPGMTVAFQYDNTSSRWRPLHSAGLSGYLDLRETSTPSDPPADTVRLYPIDDGGVTKPAYRTSAGVQIVLGAAIPQVNGLVITNSSGTPTTSIDIDANDALILDASGNAIRTGAVNLTVACAGNGANGLDTGSLGNNAWYNFFIIYNPTTDTVAGLASLSATAPTLPSGYTFSYRVGAIRTGGSATFIRIKQVGNRAQYVVVTSSTTPNVPQMTTGASGDPSVPTWTAVATGNYVPPTAVRIQGFAGFAASGTNLIVAPNNDYGAQGSTSNPPPISLAFANNGVMFFPFDWVLESTNVYYASSGAGGLMACTGWTDAVNAI